MATLTACEQAALDLAAYKKALADLLTGKRVIRVSHADKSVDYYGAGNVESLERLIRLKQVEVNKCNGVRGHRFIRTTPTDDNRW